MLIQKQFSKTEFAEQLKNIDGINADGTQSLFVLMFLGKIKEIRLKLS